MKPQPPAPPNPVTTANAQTGTNISTASAQRQLNNTNQVTPFGSATYSPSGGGYTDPTTGQFVPQYTETTTLNPQLQTFANTLEGGLKPVNPNGALNNTIMSGPQALDPSVAAAAYGAATGFLDPAFQQQNMDLQDKLTAQGIPLGSMAYGNATNQLQNTQNNARTVAANNAVVAGANQANNMYGLAVQGQQQNIAQQQLPLNQLLAIG